VLTKQVLIIDDDPGIRDSLCQVIRLMGFSVEAVANGREALEFLSCNVAPGVILLDLMMPEMSGWEFMARIKKDAVYHSIPLVVMSAYSEGVGTIHADQHLTKPMDMNDLKAVLITYCR
jgi:CheY-like chemotaxis protein